ncbi:unnamed protein product [Caenorhabditis brenneri]
MSTTLVKDDTYLTVRRIAMDLMAGKNSEKHLNYLKNTQIPAQLLIHFMIRNFLKELLVPEELENLRLKVIYKLRPLVVGPQKRSSPPSDFEPEAKKICAPGKENIPLLKSSFNGCSNSVAAPAINNRPAMKTM